MTPAGSTVYVAAACHHRSWAEESAVFLAQEGTTLVVATSIVDALRRLHALGRPATRIEVLAVLEEVHGERDGLIDSLVDCGLLEKTDGPIADHQ